MKMRFTEAQITFALRQSDWNAPVLWSKGQFHGRTMM